MDVLYNTGLVDRHGDVIMRGAGIPSYIGREFWSGATTATYSVSETVAKPYKFHPWIHRAATVVARNVSRLPLLIKQIDGERELDKANPVFKVLTRPNPLMTYSTLRESIVLNLLLSSGKRGKPWDGGGQAFIIPTLRGENCNLRKMIPDHLQVVNDLNIEPNIVESKGLSRLVGWKLLDPQTRQPLNIFEPEEIIRIYFYNPYSLFEGLASYTPAALSIEQDAKADVYNTRIFDNDGRLSGYLKLPPGASMSRDRVDEVKAKWRETYTGTGKVGQIAVLPDGVEYQQFGLPLADMQYKEQKEFNKKQAIAAMGVNRIALGDYEDINLATIREGRRMLWQDVYMPIDELINEALNVQWVYYIDGEMKWKAESDYSNIPALRYDYKERAETAALLTEKLRFPAVVSSRIAKIPLTDEDVAEYPELAEMPKQVTPNTAPDGGGGGDGEGESKTVDVLRSVAAITEDELERYTRDYAETVLDEGEKSMTAVLKRYFYSQRNMILDAVDDWLRSKKAIVLVKADYVNIEQFLPLDESEINRLLKLYTTQAGYQCEREKLKIEQEFGAEIAWNATDETISVYATQRRAQLKKINTQTFKVARDAIGATVGQGMDENWTPQEMAKHIKIAVNDVYERRVGHPVTPHGKFDLGHMSSSKTIARTEMGIVSSLSRFDAYKFEGVNEWMWTTARDQSVRNEDPFNHVALDKQVAIVGQKFKNNKGNLTELRFPRDPSGNAGDIINCRCVALAYDRE